MQQDTETGFTPMSEFTGIDRTGIRATSSEIKDTCRCLIYCQIPCPSKLQPPAYLRACEQQDDFSRAVRPMQQSRLHLMVRACYIVIVAGK
jgi:hypothetical protein